MCYILQASDLALCREVPIIGRLFVPILCGMLLGSSAMPVTRLFAQEQSEEEQVQFFEKHIRPVLVKIADVEMWMAGGGTKGGISYGATDDYGYEAVDGRVHIHDWHATILHLLGLDHEQRTFRYAGRDMRLTDVKGHVVKDIIG